VQTGGLRTKGVVKQSLEDMPLITVITVVRNGEKTLEETILSVINQTYKNIEYIIIDGASTDSTLDIIRKYEGKIDYWMSEPDEGIYYAMNKGIDLATGDFIAMLNSDDWYEISACEEIVNKIRETDADVYYGMMRVYDGDKHLHYIYAYTINAISRFMISHPSCFISHEIYFKYKYDVTYKSASDYDLLIRIVTANYKFCFIEKILVNFRMDGMSSGFKGQKEANEIKRKYRFISRSSYYLRGVFIGIRSFLKIFDV
jgi:glycosyltransferase involved in cell wall biosynthesis